MKKIYILLVMLVFTIHYLWYYGFFKHLLVAFIKIAILPLFVFVVVDEFNGFAFGQVLYCPHQ
jgi:hypothetical protein